MTPSTVTPERVLSSPAPVRRLLRLIRGHAPEPHKPWNGIERRASSSEVTAFLGQFGERRRATNATYKGMSQR